MTGDVPGLRELMRAGVRRSVAEEYRRLLSEGASHGVALVKAGGARPHGLSPRLVWRFHALYDPVSLGSCWRWQGPHNRRGYGVLADGRRKRLAHRLAWIIYSGAPLDDTLTVGHLCYVTLCVNPLHLEIRGAAGPPEVAPGDDQCRRVGGRETAPAGAGTPPGPRPTD